MKLLEHLSISDPGSAASVALHQYVSDRSTALLLRPREHQLEIGSGTCVRIGDCYLIATAGHNLEGLGPRQIEVVPTGAYHEQAIQVIAHGSSSSSVDVGWLELDPVAVERSRLKAVTLDQLASLSDEGPDAVVVLVQGYPANSVEVPESADSRPHVESDGLVTLVIPPRERSSFCAGVDFAVEYPPWDGSLDNSGLPAPPGVSGGGVWQVPIFGEDEIWALERARFIGVARSWLRSERELFAVRVEHWLNLVRKDKTELTLQIDLVVNRWSASA